MAPKPILAIVNNPSTACLVFAVSSPKSVRITASATNTRVRPVVVKKTVRNGPEIVISRSPLLGFAEVVPVLCAGGFAGFAGVFAIVYTARVEWRT
jgi:hypothetical protein